MPPPAGAWQAGLFPAHFPFMHVQLCTRARLTPPSSARVRFFESNTQPPRHSPAATIAVRYIFSASAATQCASRMHSKGRRQHRGEGVRKVRARKKQHQAPPPCLARFKRELVESGNAMAKGGSAWLRGASACGRGPALRPRRPAVAMRRRRTPRPVLARTVAGAYRCGAWRAAT